MENNWIKVSTLTDIPDDDVVGIVANGHQIALYKANGEVFATDNICTHGHALLSDGFLEDGEIECPLHQGRFCIKSGKAMSGPLTENIRSYPVRVDGQDVLMSGLTE